MNKNNKEKITVCSECLKASCWQGNIYCDDYKEAGTVDLPVWALRKLELEHESYWGLESTRPEKPQSDIKDTLLEKLEKINSIQAERIGRMSDLLEKILTEIEKELER